MNIENTIPDYDKAETQVLQYILSEMDALVSQGPQSKDIQALAQFLTAIGEARAIRARLTQIAEGKHDAAA